MRIPDRFSKLLYVLLTVFILIVAAAMLYLSALPNRYEYSIGEISTDDIVAPRSVNDRSATEEAARNARAAVDTVWVRSESISEDTMDDIELTLGVIAEARDNLGDVDPETGLPPTIQAQSTDLILEINREVGVELDVDTAIRLLTIEGASYLNIHNNVSFLGESIMADMMDKSRLELTITQKTANLADRTAQYKEDIDLVRSVLTAFLRPNTVMDQNATDNARLAAYEAALSNPVMIERGTYILHKGDLVTTEIYEFLDELSLLENSQFDISLFIGVLLHLLVVTAIGWAFIRNHAREQLSYLGNRVTLFLAIGIPFLLSAYTMRLSSLALPTYFAAVVLCAYFGLRISIVMSSLLSIAILPMSGYDVKMLLVSLAGCYVAALFARGISRRDNYAFIILSTSAVCLATITGYSIVFQTGWDAIVSDATFAIVASSLSVIAAVGLLPVFEMLLNTVSPMRLIELSQTGNILLRRLFIEAPGTSQHSVMTANLAETAAEAINANALLARVGAYYHDIGKLENPHMFIENQQGGNPHDQLPSDQSVAIITAHPELGVRIGKKYRLPPALLKIIHEHHGSTIQTFFLHKAQKEVEQFGRPEPSPEAFRYHCPVPSSQESALVMLADSVEAAVRSTGASKLDAIESLIRRIVKDKNAQDQLVNSGLSFREVELAIQAFLQVYAGHFHERIEYPDDRNIRKSPAKIFR